MIERVLDIQKNHDSGYWRLISRQEGTFTDCLEFKQYLEELINITDKFIEYYLKYNRTHGLTSLDTFDVIEECFGGYSRFSEIVNNSIYQSSLDKSPHLR